MKSKIIDWEQCVEMAGGKKEFASEMLTLFVNELPETQDQINEAFRQQDFLQLANQLHRLLGACGYCGAARLKESTAILESAVRKNPEITLLQTLLSQFNEEIKAFLEEAKSIQPQLR